MIEALTHDHLERVVDLHADILFWSINARLGHEHLREVYLTLIEDEYCIGLVDITASGELLSVIITSTKWQETRAKIHALYDCKKKLCMLWQSLRKPADYVDILENLLLLPPAMKALNKKAEILIWLSNSRTLQGRISGVKIMRTTLQKLAELHMLPAMAQVAKYDAAPNIYHANAGNQQVKSYLRNNIYLVGGVA